MISLRAKLRIERSVVQRTVTVCFKLFARLN